MPTCQIDLITNAKHPVLLSTANDLVGSDKIVPQLIGELGGVAEPYVSEQSPDVLDRAPLRSRRLRLPVATTLAEAHVNVSCRKRRRANF